MIQVYQQVMHTQFDLLRPLFLNLVLCQLRFVFLELLLCRRKHIAPFHVLLTNSLCMKDKEPLCTVSMD